MSIRNVFYFFFFTLWGCFPNPSSQSEGGRPNVILILADDQGWGDLSINGNPDLSTPNLDQLALSGARFQRFYVNSVCSPTRAAMLTGRYAVRGGVYATSEGGELLDLDEVTLAEVFRANQYRTAAFGKWHNGTQAPYHPNSRGFEEFYGFTSGHWGSYFDPMLDHNGEIVQGQGFLSDDLTSHAIEYIKQNQKEPFLVYLALNIPHSPMQVPDAWWEKFATKKLSRQHPNRDKEAIPHTRAAYALVENIDWNVGRLRQALKDLQLEKNTIVVYLSDNGPNGWRWNGGLKGKKGDTDEGGVRSPLFISWPGSIQAGLVLDTLAGVIDILPSLLDLSGMKYQFPKPLDGRSLKPLLIDQASAGPPRYLFSYWKGDISLRGQRFMLDKADHLFDLEKDPGQSQNIAGQYPQVHQKMLEAKRTWRREVASELNPPPFHRFPLAYPGAKFTHLPARDARASGEIKRLSRWPNCSFFSNWISGQDSIYWQVEVLEEGDFEVELYYTCREEDLGCQIALQTQGQSLKAPITEAWDPPLQGKEYDRYPREESFVKDFRPISLGTLHLKPGEGRMTLKALEIPGKRAIDVRLLVLKSVNKP